MSTDRWKLVGLLGFLVLLLGAFMVPLLESANGWFAMLGVLLLGFGLVVRANELRRRRGSKAQYIIAGSITSFFVSRIILDFVRGWVSDAVFIGIVWVAGLAYWRYVRHALSVKTTEHD